MSRLLLIAGMALVLTGSVGRAQTYGPRYSRGARSADNRGFDRDLFDRARADLDRAAGYPYASRDDRKRFDEARRELFDFESRFDQGRYEKHELDEAIDRMHRVVNRNSLDPRDRGVLADDLRRMRDYREFRAHNGDRDFNNGFGYRR